MFTDTEHGNFQNTLTQELSGMNRWMSIMKKWLQITFFSHKGDTVKNNTAIFLFKIKTDKCRDIYIYY